MGLLDKFREIISEPDDDFEDYDNAPTYDREPLERQSFERPSFGRALRNTEQSSSGYDRRNSEREERASRKQKSEKVLNIHNSPQHLVVLAVPEVFEESRAIADSLNEKKIVVLNLEKTPSDVSRRIVDFLSGVAYANDGQLERIATKTFIITPYNVDIEGELVDELGSLGLNYNS